MFIFPVSLFSGRLELNFILERIYSNAGSKIERVGYTITPGNEATVWYSWTVTSSAMLLQRVLTGCDLKAASKFALVCVII